MPGNLDSDAAAALALLVVARAAAAALQGTPPDSIEIVGTGLIAEQVWRIVGDRSGADRRSTPIEQPTAIVDTTGDPGVIVDATQRVANLGTVVLVGESLGRTAEMNLYPDVHVRGLTLVGVAPPVHAGTVFAQADLDDPLVASCREALVGVLAEAPLPSGAAWYRVSG
jgi:threonine dehydrogenase-like Zn-dependent dehydrogenase